LKNIKVREGCSLQNIYVWDYCTQMGEIKKYLEKMFLSGYDV